MPRIVAYWKHDSYELTRLYMYNHRKQVGKLLEKKKELAVTYVNIFVVCMLLTVLTLKAFPFEFEERMVRNVCTHLMMSVKC